MGFHLRTRVAQLIHWPQRPLTDSGEEIGEINDSKDVPCERQDITLLFNEIR